MSLPYSESIEERLWSLDLQDRLSFKEQPSLDDFHYATIKFKPVGLAGDLVLREMGLAIGRATNESEHRIRFDINGTSESDTYARPWYALLGPVDLSNPDHLERVSSFCESVRTAGKDVRINLANFFDNRRPPEAQAVQEFDRNNGCNTIFADAESGNLRYVTANDIVENIKCETVRALYKATRVNDRLSEYTYREALNRNTEDIKKITGIFDRYGLFHRARTDGAIAINEPLDTPGWRGVTLITQTKTDKTQLLPEDFSLVLPRNPLEGLTAWEPREAENEVVFIGEKLPSSDAPEILQFSEIYYGKNTGQWWPDPSNDQQAQRAPRLVIHFHHPTWTRSDNLSEAWTTDKEIPYGQFESGKEIFEEFLRKSSGAINDLRIGGTGRGLRLKNHGFFWTGDTPEQFEKFVVAIQQAA